MKALDKYDRDLDKYWKDPRKATNLYCERVNMQMDEREFCFWLKGFFDMNVSLTLTESQCAQIKAKVTEVLTPPELMEHDGP